LDRKTASVKPPAPTSIKRGERWLHFDIKGKGRKKRGRGRGGWARKGTCSFEVQGGEKCSETPHSKGWESGRNNATVLERKRTNEGDPRLASRFNKN